MGIRLMSVAAIATLVLGIAAVQQMTGADAFVEVEGRISKVEEICRYELPDGPRLRELPCEQAGKPDGEWAGATLTKRRQVEVFYVSPVDHKTHSANFVTRLDSPRIGQRYRIYAHTSQLGMIRDF